MTDGGIDRFVGRLAELDRFSKLLTKARGIRRVLYIYGGGGIGKTKLILEMLRRAKMQSGILVINLVDTFSTRNKHKDGIQNTIIEMLPAEYRVYFDEFCAPRGNTPQIFRRCMAKLCKERTVVLAIDTFENIDNTPAGDWILDDSNEGLQQPGLICVIGSRTAKQETDLMDVLELSGISEGEAFDLYNALPVTGHYVDPKDKEELGKLQEVISDLVYKTAGHPLMIELAFTWMEEGLWSREALGELTLASFEKALMDQVSEMVEEGLLLVDDERVSQEIIDTIICMAYLHRRFNRNILDSIVDKGFIRTEAGAPPTPAQRDNIIHTLEKYFFVKVREDGVLQLHDKLTDLVMVHLWPLWRQDVGGDLRRAFADNATTLYDHSIRLIQENADASLEERRYGDELRAEKLYYTFKSDAVHSRGFNRGLRLFYDLADANHEWLDLLLPGEIKNYIEKFEVSDQYEVYRLLVDIERRLGHVQQAEAYARKMSGLAQEEQSSLWWVRSKIALFNCSRSPRQGLDEHLLPALDVCKTDADVAHLRPTVEYEIGFAYDQMQDIEEAIRWYGKAKVSIGPYIQENPVRLRRLATILNDLGYSYAYLGENRKSVTHVKEALTLRQRVLDELDEQLAEVRKKLKTDPDNLELVEEEDRLIVRREQAHLRLGMTFNTRAEILRYDNKLEESSYYYTKAYDIFRVENNPRWQAKSLYSRAETYRRLAVERRGLEDKDGYDKNITDAWSDLLESLYLCERYDIDSEQATAYRRMGRWWRDRVANDTPPDQRKTFLDSALECFEQGLVYAQDTNNTLEELENLTELAFLAEELAQLGNNIDPEVYLRRLKAELDNHRVDDPQLYQYPVFEHLYELAEGGHAFALGKLDDALALYLDGYAGLASEQGYGETRYKVHYPELTDRIEGIESNEIAKKWCQAFIDRWGSQRHKHSNELLKDELEDMVEWCNLHMLIRG